MERTWRSGCRATTADRSVAAFGSDICQRQQRPRSSRSASALNDRSAQRPASRPRKRRASLQGRLHSMASGSFRDAKLERPVSGAELRRLLVASRPTAVLHRAPDATAGDRVDRPSMATAHRQGFGLSRLRVSGQNRAAIRRLPAVRQLKVIGGSQWPLSAQVGTRATAVFSVMNALFDQEATLFLMQFASSTTPDRPGLIDCNLCH